MKFIKLLHYDIRAGILRRAVLLAVTAIMYVLLVFSFHAFTGNISGQATVMDVLFYLFRGMTEYIPSPDNPFQFPAVWIIQHILLLSMTLYYMNNDLLSFGNQILLHSGGRKAWWLSKCCWNIFSAVVFYIIGFSTILLLCAMTNVDFSLALSPELNEIMGIPNKTTVTSHQLLIQILLIIPLVSVVMNLFQMTLCLFLKPVFSFIVTSVLLISSAYFFTPVLIGNYAMLLRSSFVIENGIDLKTGVILSVFLLLLSIGVGIFRFSKYDILKKGYEV